MRNDAVKYGCSCAGSLVASVRTRTVSSEATPNSATSPSPTRLSFARPPPVSIEVREYSTAAGNSHAVGDRKFSGLSTWGSLGRGFGGGAGGGGAGTGSTYGSRGMSLPGGGLAGAGAGPGATGSSPVG